MIYRKPQDPPQPPESKKKKVPASDTPARAAHLATGPAAAKPAKKQRAGQGKKKKKRRGKTALVLISLLLVAGIGTGAVLVYTGLLDSLLPTARKSGGTAYVVTGEVTAFRLAAPPEDYDAKALEEYFAAALDYATAAGFNTLVYEAKTGFAVQWRDKLLSPPAGVKAQDGLLSKLDPLDILLGQANGREIQVWLQIDPFSVDGYSPDMKGKAAAHLQAGGSASSAEYAEYLAQSLAALPGEYPIAGIVLSGEADENQTQLATQIQNSWAASGKAASLYLYLPGGADSAALQSVAASRQSLYTGLILGFTAEGALSETIAAWAEGGPLILQPVGGDASRALFTAMQEDNFAGALLTRYPSAASVGEVAILKSAYTPVDSYLPTGYALPGGLQITNPKNGETVKHGISQYYVAGISDPAEPLYFNGGEIERTGTGLFGVLVDLAYGANTFTFTQGDASASVTITRQSPPAGGDTGAPAPEYSTQAGEGRAVRVNGIKANVVADWGDANSVREIFYEGAIAEVDTIILRDGVAVAYKLTSGDYLLASTCELVGDSPRFTMGPLTATEDAGGEYIELGSGTPGVYTHYADSVLTLTIYGAELPGVDDFTSTYVRSAKAESFEGGVTLRFALAEVWGYQIEYENGSTRLFLKRVPTVNTDGSKPLEGVVILLDAGHGGDDNGASAGHVGQHLDIGPYEKDLNLSIAQATAYRLRQLGATVVMVRDDDTPSHSTERLALLREVKPDFFISFHRNSMEPNQDLAGPQGAEVYYYNQDELADSSGFAENLVNSLCNQTGRYNRGAKWSYYNVTLTTLCPAVLGEYGFVSNPAEYEGMLTQDDIYIEAEATVDAILATLTGQRIEANATDEGGE